MKIVINKCHGGFSLSPKALKAYAEAKGKPCYFFEHHYKNAESTYTPIDLEQIHKHDWFVVAFTVPDPMQYMDKGKWSEMSPEERKAFNNRYDEISLSDYQIDRTDPDLIKIIETMGSAEASGRVSELKIIEIPDDVDWVIDEYDGLEWVAERHRTWH